MLCFVFEFPPLFRAQFAARQFLGVVVAAHFAAHAIVLFDAQASEIQMRHYFNFIEIVVSEITTVTGDAVSQTTQGDRLRRDVHRLGSNIQRFVHGDQHALVVEDEYDLGGIENASLGHVAVAGFQVLGSSGGREGCLPRPERIVERCGAVVFRFFMLIYCDVSSHIYFLVWAKK